MKHINKIMFAIMASALLFAGVSHAITDRLGATYAPDFNYRKLLTKTTTYTVTTSDAGAKINADATSASFTITLPALSTLNGQSMGLQFVKTDSSVYVVTIAPATGDTIGGESARKIINQNSVVMIESAGGKDWKVTYESPYVIEDHEAGTADLGTQGYDASIIFEGATADAYETTFGVVDPTADGTLLIPALSTGTTQYTMMTSLATNKADAANAVTGTSNGVLFEGATADAYETTVAPTDATADRTITLPDATGTVALTAGLGSRVTVTAGSGTTTVTTAHCGGILTGAADANAVFNLPATSAGCVLRFINIGAAANNLLTINPDNADQIFGTVTLAASVVAIVGSAGDAVSNTKGTSIRGDSMTLVGDGVDGWYITASTGIWADIN